ncbi:hypothetical protein PRIPAC_97292, partial [Pristionchus pacificus]|uniref:Uncharacterized protein n=1 Tax=Pristionchus pacificus TaxID=54126 RepID=A0A2A6CUX9_PRIPA
SVSPFYTWTLSFDPEEQYATYFKNIFDNCIWYFIMVVKRLRWINRSNKINLNAIIMKTRLRCGTRFSIMMSRCQGTQQCQDVKELSKITYYSLLYTSFNKRIYAYQKRFDVNDTQYIER